MLSSAQGKARTLHPSVRTATLVSCQTQDCESWCGTNQVWDLEISKLLCTDYLRTHSRHVYRCKATSFSMFFKIFSLQAPEHFLQVDQTLIQHTGGCLWLEIAFLSCFSIQKYQSWIKSAALLIYSSSTSMCHYI